MKNYTHALELDQLDPIKRIKRLLKEDPLQKTVNVNTSNDTLQSIMLPDLVLLILQSIQNVLKKEYGYLPSFYIFNDASITYFLVNFLKLKVTDKELFNTLLLLEKCDLIFRFTCARKFRITDPKLKQLRINSWGEIYLKQHALAEYYNNLRSEYEDVFSSYLNKHKDCYTSVCKLLMQPINKESALEISNLNKELEIKLLS